MGLKIPFRRALPSAAVLALAAALPGGTAQAAEPYGVWINDTGRGAVEIKRCGKKLCGHVVWVKDAKDTKGCGRQIIGDAAPVGGGVWDGGWIYSPERKKTFDVEVTPLADGTLQVMGYAGVRFLSKTMIWTKAPADLKRCDAAEITAEVEKRVDKKTATAAVQAPPATPPTVTPQAVTPQAVTPPAPQVATASPATAPAQAAPPAVTETKSAQTPAPANAAPTATPGAQASATPADDGAKPSQTATAEPAPAPQSAEPSATTPAKDKVEASVEAKAETPPEPQAVETNEPEPEASEPGTSEPKAKARKPKIEAAEADEDDDPPPPRKKSRLKLGDLNLDKVLTRTKSGRCKLDLPFVKVQFDCDRD